MTTVNYSEGALQLDHVVFTWAPLTTTNADGQGASYAGSGQRSVQVNGTFGVGGTCLVEGTLDGTNWYQLSDPAGTAISFTAAGIKAIRDDVVAVRPRVTAGDGTTSLTAVLSVRRNFRN